jgi:hypothetical protein
MPQEFTATLNPQSPRYDAWVRVLGQDVVPLKSPASFLANLGEEADVEVYALAVEALSIGQCARLVDWIAENFGVAPQLAVQAINGVGFPVRAADVTVGMSMRAFL